MGDNVMSKASGLKLKFNGNSDDLPGQQIMHLLVSEDSSKKSSLPDVETQFFVLYQDAFVCGTCQKQFVDILCFILHKAEHALNLDLYRCELCSCVISSSAALVSHYGTLHRLPMVIDDATHHSSDNGLPQQTDYKQCIVEITKHSEMTVSLAEQAAVFDGLAPDPFDAEIIRDTSALHDPESACGSSCLENEEVRNKPVKIKRRRQSSLIPAAAIRSIRPPDCSETTKSQSVRCTKQTDSKAVRRSNPMSAVFPCSVCGKIFRQRRYLHKHAETHGAAHACEVCGKTYRSRAYLRLHSRRHHAAPETTQRPRFTCSECDFSSDVAAAIHAHRQVHAPSDSVRCAICGGAYADRASLSKHRRVHDAARPYACPLPGCAWRFRTDVMCRAHVRAHTIAGRFTCSFCGYVFRRKHHLQRHEVRMHAGSSSPGDAGSVAISSSSRSSFTAVRTDLSGAKLLSVRSRSTPPQGTSVRRTVMKTGDKLLSDRGASSIKAVQKSNSVSLIIASQDILLSEIPDEVSQTLASGYDHLEHLVDDDCNFSSLLDMADVELEKKNGHLILDEFDLFH